MRFHILPPQMEKFVNHSHQPKGEHIHGQFFITSPQPTTFLIPAIDSFNDISLAIRLLIKVRLSGLVLASRNHSFDMMTFDPLAYFRITVTPVADQLLGPIGLPRMVRQKHMAHQGLEPFALITLAGSQVNPHHDAVAFDQQMHFGAIATPGVTQRMVRWLKDLHSSAAIEAGLQRWLLTGSARRPTRSNNGAIDAPQAMAEATVALQVVEEMREEFGPGAIRSPTIKAVVDSLPWAIAFGNVPPRGSRVQDPENTIEQTMMGHPGMAFATVMGRVR
jgi:hypothetical protein